MNKITWKWKFCFGKSFFLLLLWKIHSKKERKKNTVRDSDLQGRQILSALLVLEMCFWIVHCGGSFRSVQPQVARDASRLWNRAAVNRLQHAVSSKRRNRRKPLARFSLADDGAARVTCRAALTVATLLINGKQSPSRASGSNEGL